MKTCGGMTGGAWLLRKWTRSARVWRLSCYSVDDIVSLPRSLHSSGSRRGWLVCSPQKGEAVDFGSVLRMVSAFLDGKSYRFALIGGVALAAYGLARTTLDLDLLVESRGQEDLIAFL